MTEGWPETAAAALEARVREAHEVGPVLVSLHWGRTGALLPTKEQRRLAARLIDAGATVVLGHGPHTPQGIERRGRGVIAYSLGNVAFSCHCTEARDAYVLRFRIDAKGAAVDVEAVPLRAGLREPPRRRPGQIPERPSSSRASPTISGSDARIEDGRVRIR